MKKTIILIGGILLVLIVAVVLFFTLNNKKYRVSFNADGGPPIETVKIESGKTITLPSDLLKEGYTFNGWLDGDIVVDNKYTVTKDVTLKANWVRETSSTITVTFDSAGGSEVAPIVIQKGETLTLPPNPTKDGYVFVSWVDVNYIPIYDQALLDGDIALTATWISSELVK